MQFIKDEQGEVYKNQLQFYQRFRKSIKVYNRNTQGHLNGFLEDIQHDMLDEEDRELWDLKFATKEMVKTLKPLNKLWARGTIPLTVKFFKLWRSLARPRHDIFTQSIQLAECSTNQSCGIIKLAHEG